ncbi:MULTISPECIES: Cof-type HAD-IIB family hydrolase [Aestuariibaculum]|uniref:Cof-type HAD-IIB family hydrolase n=1 Tax=Aestuariibaculum lutulentum TaxID=2920935 RepID=A0ABS9RGY2_9FLAO|nr:MULTISPECIES: Cof-type HAD-IIB family hydrolase [Aestuariibaculum]MCH4551771.1 Cof-type HAD-IIB family hydrolase [Aestuariibaculum lutulentum]MCR8666876.1 Cof-type HAD-IIB family hydrolase [Aestuariibaculum sp. M13]
MNLSQVKLVVSDMDGTLLNPENQVSNRFFNQFNELKKQNIHFVAASGRQYQSILDKLNLIKDDISIIAENGGIMKYNSEEHILLQLTPEDIETSVSLLRQVDGANIVLCGRKAAYIETSNPDFISKFEAYYAEYRIVEDLTQVTDDVFLKIAVYHNESSEHYILPQAEALSSKLQVIVSGQNWLDISHIEANKAYALKILQQQLGITEEETMVFGDYNNDLQMLGLAYFSYAMQNAHNDVKKIARFQTKSNSEEGVEAIIDELLNSKQI